MPLAKISHPFTLLCNVPLFQTWGPGVRDESYCSLAGSLAWKHNDAEDADAAEFAAGGDMPTESPGGVRHGQTACEPASPGGRGIVKYEVSCDWRFQPPQ